MATLENLTIAQETERANIIKRVQDRMNKKIETDAIKTINTYETIEIGYNMSYTDLQNVVNSIVIDKKIDISTIEINTDDDGVMSIEYPIVRDRTEREMKNEINRLYRLHFAFYIVKEIEVNNIFKVRSLRGSRDAITPTNDINTHIKYFNYYCEVA